MKLLEKWMAEYKANIVSKLLDCRQLRVDIQEAKRNQTKIFAYKALDEKLGFKAPICYTSCSLTENIEIVEYQERVRVYKDEDGYNKFSHYETRNYKDVLNIYTIRGKEFKIPQFRHREESEAWAKVIINLGHTKSDWNWFDNKRTDEDINKLANKLMLQQKKAIEQKVEKICGKEITHIDETTGEIFVKGSNERTAHIWAINAGGYNIQCLHIRVLVKEIK